tara:strand:- start:4 stop:417 length:414 start_codon:yes stop_codon:yes gene_type:complete
MENNAIKTLLQSRGLKATRTRINLLIKMHKHGSAISHSVIQKQMRPIDRVTLYRTLESLKKCGIIHKAFQDQNESYYAVCGKTCDKNHHQHEHVHFKCTKCNTITCEELSKTVNISLPNYQIEKISINVEGICKVCI